MNDSGPTDVPPENKPSEHLRERLNDADTIADPVSNEALVDADVIGSELREED